MAKDTRVAFIIAACDRDPGFARRFDEAIRILMTGPLPLGLLSRDQVAAAFGPLLRGLGVPVTPPWLDAVARVAGERRGFPVARPVRVARIGIAIAWPDGEPRDAARQRMLATLGAVLDEELDRLEALQPRPRGPSISPRHIQALAAYQLGAPLSAVARDLGLTRQGAARAIHGAARALGARLRPRGRPGRPRKLSTSQNQP